MDFLRRRSTRDSEWNSTNLSSFMAAAHGGRQRPLFFALLAAFGDPAVDRGIEAWLKGANRERYDVVDLDQLLLQKRFAILYAD
jgi:hypothetical protein